MTEFFIIQYFNRTHPGFSISDVKTTFFRRCIDVKTLKWLTKQRCSDVVCRLGIHIWVHERISSTYLYLYFFQTFMGFQPSIYTCPVYVVKINQDAATANSKCVFPSKTLSKLMGCTKKSLSTLMAVLQERQPRNIYNIHRYHIRVTLSWSHYLIMSLRIDNHWSLMEKTKTDVCIYSITLQFLKVSSYLVFTFMECVLYVTV